MIRCGECNVVLDETGSEPVEERAPCPACGSTSRFVEQHLAGEVELRSMLSLKAKPERGRWFMSQKVGDELFRKTGRWHRVTRVLDRRRNRYVERIEDAETGEVVRHVDEPLTDHTGRGSARRQRQPPSSAS